MARAVVARDPRDSKCSTPHRALLQRLSPDGHRRAQSVGEDPLARNSAPVLATRARSRGHGQGSLWVQWFERRTLNLRRLAAARRDAGLGRLRRCEQFSTTL